MIAIGEINAVEPAAPGDSGRPLPATIPELLKGLSDPNQIDAVRVAAMVGLLRHAKAKIPPEDPNHAAVSAACLALLQTTAPPAGRTPEGHGWMRAQAAEILGELGGTTGVANVATALGAMAGETALSVSSRRLAVRALGKLNLSGANVANGAELVGSVARFVFDALSLENPANLSKRRLRQSMLAAQECVTAIKTVATDAPSRQVLAVLEPAVTALADATEGSDAALLEAITKQRAALQPLLR
jgi:hypothetical protein